MLTRKENLGWSYLKMDQIKGFIKQYKKFPIYSLPSEFMSTFTNQLPVYFLSYFSGPAAVGVYGLAVRMIGLPVQFIGGAISTVFKQRATEDFNRDGNFYGIFMKTLKSLIIVSLPMVAVILLFGQELFSFVFGKEWINSGLIAQILIVMFALKLIISPLSYAYYIRQKLKEDALIHIYILFSSLIIFFTGIKFFDDYTKILLVFSINYSLVYLFYLFRSYRFAINKA
jgi:O-antigen/teichoic acid export membrane protein